MYDHQEVHKYLSSNSGSDSPLLDLESLAQTYARRRIVCSSPISKGDIFSADNLTTKRGTEQGLPASQWNSLLNRRAYFSYDIDQMISIHEFDK